MVVVVGGLLEMRLVGLALLTRAVITYGTNAEEADHVLQGFGLRRELFRSAREFLCASRVPLCYQTNLADCPVDLVHTSSLLPGRCGHFLHQVGGLLNGRDEFGQQTARALRDLHVGSGQAADFLSRSTATFREVAYFACHHGESTAVFAGTR